ncbi:MAG: hypothetical protein R2909_19890 [Gemmatimonadales bacterium]
MLPGGRLLFGTRTTSSDAPTTSGAYQRSFGGGPSDTFIGIVSADGSRLEAATYFGGNGLERPTYGMAVTSNGDIVFTSGTTSSNLPTTASSYRRNVHPAPIPSPGDGYVCRISGDLRTMRWCTYTGGGWPRGGLILDGQDNVLVAGDAKQVSVFATTPGATQTQIRGEGDGFILKLNAAGTQALFATVIGGSEATFTELAIGLGLAPNGDVLALGVNRSQDFPTTAGAAIATSPGPTDGFVARVSPDGTTIRFATLFGGNGNDAPGHPLATLPDGSTLFAGSSTNPSNLPGAVRVAGGGGGQNDGYLAKLNAAGTGFDFVSVFGGSGSEHTLGPVVDAAGRIYVVGSTTAGDFPVTSGALQPNFGGGGEDGFLVVFDPTGQVLYSSFVGGSGADLIRGVALGPAGEVYLVGHTDSPNFPVTPGAAQTQRGGALDGFVIKLVPR